MKTLKTLMVALMMVCVASISKAADLKQNEAEVTFKTSIDCGGCKSKLEKNIPFEKGVEDLKVNLADKTVYIKYRSDKTNVENLQKAIEKLGYKAEPMVKGESIKK